MFSDENITRLIPPEEKQKKKKPLRKSIHSGLCPPSYSTFGLKGTSKPGVQNVGGSTKVEAEGHHEFVKGAANLGPPLNSIKPSPQSPLQKQSKTQPVKTLSQIKHSNPHLLQSSKHKPKIKPQVPKASERPIFGVKSSMNFVKYNAIINMLSRPPQTKPEKNFLKKEEYGQTPKYLNEVKDEVQKEYDFIRSLRDKHQQEGKEEVRVLSEEERLSLLKDLNTKYDKINKEYQHLAFTGLTDSISKERRKDFCEEQLAKLERYIDTLKSSTIYIIRDTK